MSKLSTTFLRAVVYKAVWKMPWWVIVIILLGMFLFAKDALMQFIA